jgi:hypothetical protein
MTKALVILISVAIVLGIIAFVIVFSPGTYNLVASPQVGSTPSGMLSFNGLANATGTGTNASSGSAFVGNASNSPDAFASNYSYPYVMNWNEGQNDFSIAGATLKNNTLSLSLKIQVGNLGGCIPIDLRLVTDESGDVTPPAQPEFSFPDTESCNATPNATYQDQIVTFSLPASTPSPYLFTTGGASNQFFQVATTTDNGVRITLPATSG